jgi:hypothetical protein
VVFHEPVTGFTADDVSFVGSAGGGTLVASVSGSGASYTVSVTGMKGTGTVRASVGAGATLDLAGNSSAASTSSDDTVAFIAPTLSGTKTVTGSFAELGALRYTVTLRNSGTAVQGDHLGDEFADTLPSSLNLGSAQASGGTAGTSGNTVYWNGSIPVGGSVTINIDATVNAGTVGTLVSNQGTVSFDASGDGANETDVLTDDPTVPGTDDPTTFRAMPEGSLAFHTVDPCRVIDTRSPTGPSGGPALVAGADRSFTIVGTCGIPPTAKAVSLNIAVTAPSAAGNLRLHPAATTVPLASAINYTAGQTRANNLIVQLNALGRIGVYCAQASGTVHFILDVNGYLQ